MATKSKQEQEQQPPQTQSPLNIPPAAPVQPVEASPQPATPPKAEKPVDKSARAFDAVDFPVIACIGCNSTNTVRIDTELKLPYHKRICRACGKQFKEPQR